MDGDETQSPAPELAGVRVVYGWVHHSEHSSRLLQDIVDRPASSEGLVIACQVDGSASSVTMLTSAPPMSRRTLRFLWATPTGMWRRRPM